MLESKKDQRKLIRNFSIIAHIDHGKSTLADKIIRITNSKKISEKTLSKALDNLIVEKEKGITIKLNPIKLEYNLNNESYIFNLIDTPGHADFGYEVSRSLASCEGVILLVDSTKGVQAQTITYLRLAQKLNLKIIPVINKIDSISAKIEEVQRQLTKLINFNEDELNFISSKTGLNIEKLLKKIVEYIPDPTSSNHSFQNDKSKLKGLVFDLIYDRYNGVIVYVRIFKGSLKINQRIKFFYNNKKIFQIEKIGAKTPEKILMKELKEGEIG